MYLNNRQIKLLVSIFVLFCMNTDVYSQYERVKVSSVVETPNQGALISGVEDFGSLLVSKYQFGELLFDFLSTETVNFIVFKNNSAAYSPKKIIITSSSGKRFELTLHETIEDQIIQWFGTEEDWIKINIKSYYTFTGGRRRAIIDRDFAMSMPLFLKINNDLDQLVSVANDKKKLRRFLRGKNIELPFVYTVDFIDLVDYSLINDIDHLYDRVVQQGIELNSEQYVGNRDYNDLKSYKRLIWNSHYEEVEESKEFRSEFYRNSTPSPNSRFANYKINRALLAFKVLNKVADFKSFYEAVQRHLYNSAIEIAINDAPVIFTHRDIRYSANDKAKFFINLINSLDLPVDESVVGNLGMFNLERNLRQSLNRLEDFHTELDTENVLKLKVEIESLIQKAFLEELDAIKNTKNDLNVIEYLEREIRNYEINNGLLLVKKHIINLENILQDLKNNVLTDSDLITNINTENYPIYIREYGLENVIAKISIDEIDDVDLLVDILPSRDQAQYESAYELMLTNNHENLVNIALDNNYDKRKKEYILDLLIYSVNNNYQIENYKEIEKKLLFSIFKDEYSNFEIIYKYFVGLKKEQDFSEKYYFPYIYPLSYWDRFNSFRNVVLDNNFESFKNKIYYELFTFAVINGDFSTLAYLKTNGFISEDLIDKIIVQFSNRISEKIDITDKQFQFITFKWIENVVTYDEVWSLAGGTSRTNYKTTPTEFSKLIYSATTLFNERYSNVVTGRSKNDWEVFNTLNEHQYYYATIHNNRNNIYSEIEDIFAQNLTRFLENRQSIQEVKRTFINDYEFTFNGGVVKYFYNRPGKYRNFVYSCIHNANNIGKPNENELRQCYEGSKQL